MTPGILKAYTPQKSIQVSGLGLSGLGLEFWVAWLVRLQAPAVADKAVDYVAEGRASFHPMDQKAARNAEAKSYQTLPGCPQSIPRP